ncbi:MAG: class I SAM-dependent methyltransferase [Verrucomicrobiales bacterium]
MADQFPGRWNRDYCYWKLRTDPLYPAVTEALLLADEQGRHAVLDIGCGLGLFARYLKEAGFQGSVVGMDYDKRKIRGAQGMAKEVPCLTFTQGDVREALPEFRGHITILDVLQYLDEAQQEELLTQVVASLAPGACLIIRSGLAEPTWRFRVTRIADWLAHGCFWMKGRPVAYPVKERLESHLQEAHLKGEFTPLWGGTPFNNYFGVFRLPQPCVDTD